MQSVEFASRRWALHFAESKVNLHEAGCEFNPHARRPIPGSVDLCFLCGERVGVVKERLERHGITVEEGPVKRDGALGPLLSIYFRDPDGNLIEVANRVFDE